MAYQDVENQKLRGQLDDSDKEIKRLKRLVEVGKELEAQMMTEVHKSKSTVFNMEKRLKNAEIQSIEAAEKEDRLKKEIASVRNQLSDTSKVVEGLRKS